MTDPTEWGAQPVEGGPESWGATPIQDAPQQQQIPQAFIDRIRRGYELQQQVSQAGDSFEKRFNEAYGDPFEAAAKRTQRAAGPHVEHTPYSVAYAALHALVISPILAAKELTQRAMGGEMLDVSDPDVVAKGQAAAGLGMFFGTHFSRVTAESTQRIGTLPQADDFWAGAQVLASEHAEQNLRDLWDERGIHPAEAVHDADRDSFLRADLTHPNPEPLDRSGISPAQGSPIPHGTPRTELAKTGEAHIDAVLDSEVTNRNIDNPVINDRYDVPYSAGGSTPLEDPTVYIDRNFPRSMTIDGVTFDPADPFTIHENVEQHVMDLLIRGGMDDGTAYKVAHHEWAEKAEGAWYKAHGIDQAKAEEAYQPYIDAIEHENPANPPPNLYEKPYPHQDIRSARNETGPVPEPTAAEIAQAKAIVARAVQAGELRSAAAGADITRPENMPSLEAEPTVRPGGLVARGRAAIDQTFGLARNIQYMVDPMATGSDRAMVITKDAVSSVRRIQFEMRQRMAEIDRRFSLEQQTRMWDAGDEESVALQLGESREHQGWATLERDERYFVEYLDGLAQEAWAHGLDAGLVKGDGLPAYMPRMLVNVAMAEGSSPRALNALGRNVFTRTAQMFRRGHMMAEDTEAAAKQLVRARMEGAGATPDEIEAAIEKVSVGRNIKALPLAIARMEEAAIWKTMIDNIKEVGKATGEDLVLDYQPSKEWATVEGHPAFREWRPELVENPVTGKKEARIDDAGNTVFRPRQLYIAPEFRGPLKAILDKGPDALDLNAPNLYGTFMALKGKVMTTILNSPLIHNEVVWGKVMEAAGGRQWLGFQLYTRGNRIAGTGAHPTRAQELIEAGLNPMGPRGAIQDITAIMEQPTAKPGRSVTAEIARFIPDLFDPARPGQTVGGPGDKVAAAIDKAGDFWHNTLLWDRVRDVQFGLADFLSDRFVGKGLPREVADRIAAHTANMVVGSIPKEAMSAGAQATANVLLFSRSFTLGNLAMFKQAVVGLPKPILAQIERDFGVLGLGEEEAAQATQIAKGIGRRKAVATIAGSVALYYITNAIYQHAFNILANDSTVDKEVQGYAERLRDLAEDTKRDPSVLLNTIGRLSPTYNNEPNKQDRVHIGYDKDGTAVYFRNPVGKYGEEGIGYPSMPIEMFRRKLNPLLVRPFLEVLFNDKGFGQHIYNDLDKTAAGDVAAAIAIGKHFGEAMLPSGQIKSGIDLLRGEGDATVNKFRLFGPALGFTASEGRPGGMAKGELGTADAAFRMRFNLGWPDIRRQIQRGDFEGAIEAMTALGIPPARGSINQRSLIRAATNPAFISGTSVLNFYQHANPEQIRRFERATGVQ